MYRTGRHAVMFRIWDPRSNRALARRRSRRPRIEVLEDRLALAVAIDLVTTIPGAEHSAYGAPVLDSSGNIYTTIIDSTTFTESVIKSVGDNNTNIASFGSGTTVENGLVVDNMGDVLGAATGINYPTENVFEVPAGQSQWQAVNANILAGISSAGVYAGDSLEGLALSNQNLFGLSVGTTGANGPGDTMTALAVVWQYALAGGNGNVNVLASWQFPTVELGDSYSASGLTIAGNSLYGVTNGTEAGSATVFSVPITGGSWNTLATFSSTSFVSPGLAVSGGYVYGTYESTVEGTMYPTDVFAAPTGGLPGEYQVPLPTTVGIYAGHGLVNDQGTIVGEVNGGAAGNGAIFSVDVDTPTNPTPQPLTTFAALNFNETAASGLAVDSQGNVYGVAYDASDLVGVYKVSGLLGSASTPTQTRTPTQAVVMGEQPLFEHKPHKKGKPAGKVFLSGFTLDFNIPLNAAAARNAANYQVDTITTKRIKKKTVQVLHPITDFTVWYVAASDAVEITFGVNETFPTGGRLTVLSGLATASDGVLSGNAVFTIAKGGKSVVGS